MLQNVNKVMGVTKNNIYSGNAARRFRDTSAMNSAPAAAVSTAVLRAGAAVTDLTPAHSVFLYGYPNVARHSTGVHDRLECAALYVESGAGRTIFLANDLINVSKRFTADVRRRIAERTGVAPDAIVVTATHTHSGPVMVDYLSNAADAMVPKADERYVAWVAEQMVSAACSAYDRAQPAEVGLVTARAAGVGGNRHDPAGPADPDVPVLAVRAQGGGAPIAVLLVYGMHPTVLHEDSTVISGDFPHFTRQYVQQHLVGAGCPVLYLSGAAGNQSPRHHTKANTLAEARRLGDLIGQQIAAVWPRLEFLPAANVAVRSRFLELTTRNMPTAEAAERALVAAREKFDRLRCEGAPRATVRTAECDVFGAEESLELARAAVDGRLARAAAECAPAEIQAVTIGPWTWVCWPGELFVEYALEVKRRAPGTNVVTLANGELQAYIATAEADAAGFYEARNALFSPDNGPRIVEATLALLAGKL